MIADCDTSALTAVSVAPRVGVGAEADAAAGGVLALSQAIQRHVHTSWDGNFYFEALPPKGDVFGCSPFLTLFFVAGSKKISGSFAGSCA